MLFVILACRPPIFSTNLSTIQDDAEPLAISTMSLRRDPQLFQKDSNASTNSDCGVSIQGISSMKMTLRFIFKDFGDKVRLAHTFSKSFCKLNPQPMPS